VSEHAATAIDQLRLADSCGNDHQLNRADEHLGYLAKAVVHAILDVAAAVREAAGPVALVDPRSEQEMADLAAEWTKRFGTR